MLWMQQRPKKVQVALLAEGVGRNIGHLGYHRFGVVALLAEGVGRNITILSLTAISASVALLAEGVGRNHMTLHDLANGPGRPPRGGRG